MPSPSSVATCGLPQSIESLEGLRAYSIEPDRLRHWQVATPGTVLSKDGRNMASVLREIRDRDPNDMQRICELLQAIVPTIQRVEVKEYGRKLALEFTQRWDDGPRTLILDASAMSDGTLRALGLLAAPYQRSTPSLIAIEEPEATIHPGALGVILDVLQFRQPPDSTDRHDPQPRCARRRLAGGPAHSNGHLAGRSDATSCRSPSDRAMP